MNAIDPVITVITVVANLGIGIAGMARATPVVANAEAVRVSSKHVPLLGAFKVAGALGLLVGLLGIQPIGVLAGAGLVAFFVGAVLFHVRAGVIHNLAFPGTFLALAVASLVLAIVR